jgi:hypothetical protein
MVKKMTKILSALIVFAFVGSAQAHVVTDYKYIDDDPDPCLNLAIPYDLCLQTIGKEWLERQRKNAPPSLEERIRKLEKIINDIQRTR